MLNTLFRRLRTLLPRRLHTQLAILFALLFATSAGSLAVYTTYAQSKHAEQQLLIQAQSLTTGLAAALMPSLGSQNLTLIETVLLQAGDFPEIRSIEVIKLDGRVVSRVTRLSTGRLISMINEEIVPLPSVAVPKASSVLLKSAAGDRKELEVWVPIGTYASMGWMRSHFSTASLDTTYHELLRDSMWIALLASTIATLLVFLFLKRPMQRLGAATSFAEHLEYSYGDVLSADAGVADIDSLTQALNKASIRLYQQQAALARSEAHFRTVVEGLSELVFETDEFSRWTYLNPAWMDITQYDIDEGLGRSVLAFAPTEEHARITAAFKPLYKGQTEQIRDQFRYRAKDGSIRWLEVFARARHDELDRFIGYMGSVTDITTRKQAEHTLQGQLHFMEALIEAIPNPIYVKDREGRYMAFNQAFERFFGIQREEWLGKTVFDLYDNQDMARWHYERDKILLAEGNVQRFEARVRTRAGLEVDTLYQKSIFASGDSNTAGILGSIADISERKQFEQELLRAKEAAEAASQAKSDFLANMSHEIRTPMNAIIGMTDLALDTDLSSEQREYLSLVRTSADALMTTIDDILDFSKIESGDLRFENLIFNVRDCVASTIRIMDARASEKRLLLDSSIAPELPSLVSGDPHRLRQVLLKLLANALKFTEQGEVHLAVDILEEHADQVLLRFAISDTGVGIPTDKQAVIFEAFSQADTSSTRRFGGTGLGLAICARLVEVMGGKIWVESAPGQGSTFFFTARLNTSRAAAAEDLAAEHGAPRPWLSPQPRNGALQLLIAEDNPVNQTLAVRILGKLGHTTEIANNGKETLEKRQAKHDFDAILMDIQMPIMSGLEATRAIREFEQQQNLPRMPIVAMTAHAMPGDRERCLESGMDGYLTKPILTENLVAELATVLHRMLPANPARPKRPVKKVSGPFNRPWMLDQIGGDVALMHEVTRIFLADCPRIERNLLDALAENNCEALFSSAHSTKGSVGNFGASAAVSCAQALERACKANDLAQLAPLTQRLIEEIHRLMEALKLELAK